MQKDEAGGPYMTKGDQWIGYDDKAYVARKVRTRQCLFLFTNTWFLFFLTHENMYLLQSFYNLCVFVLPLLTLLCPSYSSLMGT